MIKSYNDFLKNGGKVTHFLEVETSSFNDITKDDIIFKLLNSSTKEVNGILVNVCWERKITEQGLKFHANIPFFSDYVIWKHTDILIDELLAENEIAEIDFLITRVCEKEVPIAKGLVFLPPFRLVSNR